MHIQIVTFNLKNLSDADFRQGCEQGASAFASIPGCISKTWLADPATNTYGGVYAFVDRAAMENYVRSDLFKGIQSNPNFANVGYKEFGVLEGPTRITSRPAHLVQAAE